MKSYSFEKAQEEASEMQKKVSSGEAKDYSDAEKMVEYDLKFQKLLELFGDHDFEYLGFDTKISFEEINKERKNREASDLSVVKHVLMIFGFRKLVTGEEKNIDPKLKKMLEKFKGKPLVDIGAGSREYGYELANFLGASAYIAIEPNFAKSLIRSLQEHIQEKKQSCPSMPVIICEGDALTILKKMKSGSVNAISSATDSFILRNWDYNEEVSQQIERVLGDDDVFINYDSVLFPKNCKKNYEIHKYGARLILFSKSKE